MNGTASDRCRVVLVRPTSAANLGSVARVMRNFAVADLWLVAAHADPADDQARQLSTQGEAILQAARSVPDLGDAVADCVRVAATSARTGGLIRAQATPADLLPRLVNATASGPVALVFGPEQTRLTNAEVRRGHHLITIPAAESYPVLNLAQAVAICWYEFHLAMLARREPLPARAAASHHQQEPRFARRRP